MTLEYLATDNNWVVINGLTSRLNGVDTISYDLSIDQETNRMKFSLYDWTKQFAPLKPDTVVRVKEQPEVNYSYWLVGNWTKDISYDYATHNVELKDLLEITKNYKVEPISFYPNRYTLDDVFTRLFRIAKFDGSFSYSRIPNFNQDWRNPRYTFTSMTLYNAIQEIARTLNRLPKIVDITIPVDKPIYRIGFERLDGLEKAVHPIDVLNGKLDREEYVDNGLTNSVYAEVQNIVGDFEMYYPSKDFGVKPNAIDESPVVDTTNAVITLKNNIKEINEIRLFGYNFNSISDEYLLFNEETNFQDTFYSGDGSGGISGSYIIKVMEKQEYDKLDNKELVFFFEKGKNYLDLRNFDVGSGPNGVRGFLRNTVSSPLIDYNLLGNTFAINYTPIAEDLPIEESNNFEIKRTVFYNQTEKMVDSDKLADTLKGYVRNMESKDLLKEGTFDNYIDIPKVSDNVIGLNDERFVIVKSSITKRGNYYEAVFQLNENFARRSENIGADTSFILHNIPQDDITNRLTLERDIIKLSVLDEINDIDTSRLTSYGKKQFLNALVQLGVSGTPNTVAIDFYNNPLNHLQNIIDTMTIVPSGRNISLNIKAQDNRVYGTKADKSITQLYTYTDEIGEVRYHKLKICKFPFSYGSANFNTISANFPISTRALNDGISASNIMVDFGETHYQKDAFERFNFTYQVNYKGTNNTMVSNDFIRDLIVFNPNVNNISLKMALFSENIGELDKMPTPTGTGNPKTLGVPTWVVSGGKTYLEIPYTGNLIRNYKSIVIFNDITGKPYLIKNYSTSRSWVDNKYIRIYFSFEKG